MQKKKKQKRRVDLFFGSKHIRTSRTSCILHLFIVDSRQVAEQYRTVWTETSTHTSLHRSNKRWNSEKEVVQMINDDFSCKPDPPPVSVSLLCSVIDLGTFIVTGRLPVSCKQSLHCFVTAPCMTLSRSCLCWPKNTTVCLRYCDKSPFIHACVCMTQSDRLKVHGSTETTPTHTHGQTPLSPSTSI